MIGIVGPRQAGKTTLAQQVFGKYTYVNLEELDTRRFATDDPRGFLRQYDRFVILDEVQRTPELFSYLQAKVDTDKIPGQYILTGSQHFLMLESITQTLAGRIAMFQLYPLAYEELVDAGKDYDHVQEHIFTGGYPRLYASNISSEVWLNSYIQTYLDRDVSTLSNIENLALFEKFLRLSAGRTGQLLNYSNLARDVGVSHTTLNAWVSLLETSGIIHLLPPYFTNTSKRLIKSPKMYFVDTGLACRLLGIQAYEQLVTHPLYGALFETWVVTEILKNTLNQGKSTPLYFWRDQGGREIDLIVDESNIQRLCEIKSSETIPADVFKTLQAIEADLPDSVLYTIYGGNESQARTMGDILSWKNLNRLTR